MRLIDADKLHYSRIRIAHSDGTFGGYNAVVMSAEIKDAPTVDAVPVIRCRDCKHRFESMEMITKDGNTVQFGHYCKATGQIVNDDDFCAWAERRADDA